MSLTACSDSVNPDVSDPVQSNSPYVLPSESYGIEGSGSTGSVLDQARAANADSSQIEILEKDDISFADYEAAVNRSLTCMREAGIDVVGPDVDDSTGLMLLNYGWSSDVSGLTEDQGRALGDDCLNRFSFWVEAQYSVQPSSIEAKEVSFEKYRPAVVECIRDNGGTIRDNASRTEAAYASFAVQDKTGVDCFEKSGIRI